VSNFYIQTRYPEEEDLSNPGTGFIVVYVLKIGTKQLTGVQKEMVTVYQWRSRAIQEPLGCPMNQVSFWIWV